MATKKQMFDERLSNDYTWEQIEGMTKPEVEDLYNNVPRGTIDDEPENTDFELDDAETIDSINANLSDYSEATDIKRETNPQPQQKKPTKKKAKFAKKTIISGYMMLLIIDLVFPNVLIFAYNRIKGTNLSATDLMLSSDQKSELEPLADEAAKSLSMEVNPMTLFLISMGTFYAANFFALTGNFNLHRK